jgi:hypothetical protein
MCKLGNVSIKATLLQTCDVGERYQYEILMGEILTHLTYILNGLKDTNFIYGKTCAVYIITYQKQNPSKGCGISKKY